MIAADAVVIWQVHQLAAQTQVLNAADKASSAIVRLHLDVNSFSGRVTALTRSHDSRQFASEAALLRQAFLRHVQDADQVLRSSPEIAQDPLISSALKTLTTTLPSQIDSEIELARAGDWLAIQLRLTGQIQDLIDLSSSLVEGAEERVFQQRARANEQTEQVRRRLFIVVPVACFLTLLAAAALGWYVTRSITVPLSQLTTGAQALARGDFSHQVSVGGSDELAILGKAFDYAAQQLRHRFEITLEARVAERTRIARDLHDTLLQSFQALLPLFQAAIYKLPEGAVDSRTTLEAAVGQASQAISEGRDAVQGLRMSTMENNDLAVAIRTVGEELAAAENEQTPTSFEVLVVGTPRSLHLILRDEAYRLAVEAMRNAFRHAAAQNVEAQIRYDEKYFRIRVRDDGKGIRPEVLRGEGPEGHYGLTGMRERAKLVGGKLTIWTEVDRGTEIELIIPASKAYEVSTRRVWHFEGELSDKERCEGDDRA